MCASRETTNIASPVMVVSQVFHPDGQSTSQLLSGVLRELAIGGHAIEVVSGYPGDPKVVAGKHEIWCGVTIVRGGFRCGFKRSMARRVAAYVSYSMFVISRVLAAPRGTRIFVVTNPPFAPLVVGIVCRLRRLSYIVMLQDIYPEGLVAVERLRAGGVIERFWHLANGQVLRRAREVWVLGRDMVDLVTKKYAVPAQRIRYIPHWSPVEPHLRRRAEETSLWRRLRLEDKFIVQYSGNMGLWHDLDSIVGAAILLADRPDVHFLFIGGGIKRAAAELLAAERGCENVTWLPFQPMEALEDSLACCHVALISQRAGLEGVAVPSKLYGILASGRPVIAQVPSGSEVALVVTEDNCGIVVPPGDAQALAVAVRRLAGDRDEAGRMGEAAFSAYRRKYTLHTGADAFRAAWGRWPIQD